MAYTVTIQGLDDLVGRLTRASSIEGLVSGMSLALTRFENRLKVYPAPRRKRVKFKSDAQRKFFFANLGGSIIVPYPRTMTLANSWHSSVGIGSQTVEGRLNNTAPYASMVLSPGEQVAYHRGNWKTIDKQLEEYSGEMVEVIGSSFILTLQ